MEIEESRPTKCYWKLCDSLGRSQFSKTCKLLILKGKISRGLSANFMKKLSK